MWPGPFDHHLAAVLPGLQRQLAQRLQLGELGGVVGVGQAAGPQAVAEAEGHVVGPHDLAQLVEVRVPGVLLVMGQHPAAHQRAAAADDAGDALGRQRQVFLQHAGVDRHVIDALLGLVLDHVEHHPRRDVGRVLDVLDDLVDRHGADRHRRGVDDAPGGCRRCRRRCERSMTVSEPRWTAVCSFSSSSSTLPVTAELPMLALILHLRGDADAHRLELFRQMDRVGRNDHAAAGHLVADQLRVQVLALGDEMHFGCNDALAGGFELRHCFPTPV